MSPAAVGEDLSKTDSGVKIRNNSQSPPLVTSLPASAEVRSAGGQVGRGRRPPREGPRALGPPGPSKDVCGLHSLFSSQLDSVSVKHTALSLVAVILNRAFKTIEHCLNKEAWRESGVYTAAVMEDFVQLFREALSKVGPEPGLASSQGAQQLREMSSGAQTVG